MQFAQKAAFFFNTYAPNSSLHGLYHFYRSKSVEGRIFWLVILLLAIGGGLYHTVMSAKRYLNMDIFVHVSDDAVNATFPDITVCNAKPFGESLLVYYADVVDDYFKVNWDYFDRWFVQDRKLRPKEQAISYKNRLKRIFARFIEVLWVSEDSRDLGMTDRVAILHCSYEGRHCDGRNFSLVRHPDGWNCYKFVPDGSTTVGSQGLTLVLFTDSNFYHRVHDGSALSQRSTSATASKASLSFNRASNLSELNSLRYFLQSRHRSLNQVAAPSLFQSDGVRVIVHEPGSHPMTSLHRLEFEAGVTGSVTIQQMLMERLHRPPLFECSSPPYKQIRYITDFDAAGRHTYRAYNKLLDEHVIEAKQDIVFNDCGCYSHRYPFHSNLKSLCYYTPPEQRRAPSEELQERLDCHDSAVQKADEATYRLVTQFGATVACESMMLGFTTNVFSWPKNEDLASLVNNYIVRSFLNGTDFLPGDGREHRIFNFTDGRIAGMLGARSRVSRQQAILRLLLSRNCSTDPAVGRLPLEDFWCLDSNELLRRNVVKLDFRHRWRQSRLAKEYYSYHWPEALSELGGICGLWLGVSVLTLFELLQVCCLTDD